MKKSINLMLKVHLITSLLLQIKNRTNIFPWENPSLQPCGLNYLAEEEKTCVF